MNLLNKTVSFVAFMACIPAALAVTARPSVVSPAASRMRMPTMSLSSNTLVGSTTTSGSSTTTTTLTDMECVDAYRECISADDACGPDFAECTNNVLFHAQMPKCISTLSQCSTSGINSLFGTSSISALSDSITDSDGEITDYTYPKTGSVLEQMITAAEISNRYDTGTCIRRYTSCLHKDNVCGNDFELCTSNTEFKKQKVFCESTLARCQADGKTELFGSTNTTANPTDASRIGIMIKEGADLAAINAVSTCYKVVDQCFLNACQRNPFKCMDGSSDLVAALADAINGGTAVNVDAMASTINNQQVSAYLRNACLDTIGSNKYCHVTMLEMNRMPTATELRDEDLRDEVYQLAYSSRMNASLKSKLTDLINEFDASAKKKCGDTIKSCAMRACGDGNGAVCYSTVFGAASKSINDGTPYEDVRIGCSDIVNTDTYCKYAAANVSGSGDYTYSYLNSGAFDTLFPKYTENSSNDPIGVVAALNASLSTSFNSAALAQKKKQCQSVATSCVKSMCGADYVNCYRNRTDIYSSLTNAQDMTQNATDFDSGFAVDQFNKSMNKVGGVLDYTIVLGLCLDTVKNASACQDHLAIETAKAKVANQDKTKDWGVLADASVRGGWIDAGGATGLTAELAERVHLTDDNGNKLCYNSVRAQGICDTADSNGDLYDEPIYVDTYTYAQSQAANTLFADLIYDLEKEAQAKYNAKLTREQNMCISSNAGGILGSSDSGSTYMWVKLKSKKVPDNYSVMGLNTNQYVASNDLYGSFCRIRVTLQSDNREIQKLLANAKWANGYFAAGDTFTCGSWIPSEDLETFAAGVSCERAGGKWDENKEECSVSDQAKKTRGWLTALGAVGTAVGGGFLGDAIASGDIMGGLSGLGDNTKANSKTTYANTCSEYVVGILNRMEVQSGQNSLILDDGNFAAIEASVNAAVTNAKRAGVNNAVSNKVTNALKTLKSNKNAVNYQAALRVAVVDLGQSCDAVEDGKGISDSGRRVLGTALGSAVTGAAGGLTVYYATKDIQEMNLTKEQQAAYQEWMDNFGKYIHCYIGGDEAGSYGDIISTSLE